MMYASAAAGWIALMTLLCDLSQLKTLLSDVVALC